MSSAVDVSSRLKSLANSYTNLRSEDKQRFFHCFAQVFPQISTQFPTGLVPSSIVYSRKNGADHLRFTLLLGLSTGSDIRRIEDEISNIKASQIEKLDSIWRVTHELGGTWDFHTETLEFKPTKDSNFSIRRSCFAQKLNATDKDKARELAKTISSVAKASNIGGGYACFRTLSPTEFIVLVPDWDGRVQEEEVKERKQRDANKTRTTTTSSEQQEEKEKKEKDSESVNPFTFPPGLMTLCLNELKLGVVWTEKGRDCTCDLADSNQANQVRKRLIEHVPGTLITLKNRTDGGVQLLLRVDEEQLGKFTQCYPPKRFMPLFQRLESRLDHRGIAERMQKEFGGKIEYSANFRTITFQFPDAGRAVEVSEELIHKGMPVTLSNLSKGCFEIPCYDSSKTDNHLRKYGGYSPSNTLVETFPNKKIPSSLPGEFCYTSGGQSHKTSLIWVEDFEDILKGPTRRWVAFVLLPSSFSSDCCYQRRWARGFSEQTLYEITISDKEACEDVRILAFLNSKFQQAQWSRQKTQLGDGFVGEWNIPSKDARSLVRSLGIDFRVMKETANSCSLFIPRVRLTDLVQSSFALESLNKLTQSEWRASSLHNVKVYSTHPNQNNLDAITKALRSAFPASTIYRTPNGELFLFAELVHSKYHTIFFDQEAEYPMSDNLLDQVSDQMSSALHSAILVSSTERHWRPARGEEIRYSYSRQPENVTAFDCTVEKEEEVASVNKELAALGIPSQKIVWDKTKVKIEKQTLNDLMRDGKLNIRLTW